MLPPVTTDQRGFLRPFDDPSIPNAPGGDGADIGAFEIQAAPTAADASISGRIATSDGRGISNARVTVTDSNGAAKSAATNSFGYFRFESVAAGETYIVTARHKTYQFAARVISVNEDVSELNFTPLP